MNNARFGGTALLALCAQLTVILSMPSRGRADDAPSTGPCNQLRIVLEETEDGFTRMAADRAYPPRLWVPGVPKLYCSIQAFGNGPDPHVGTLACHLNEEAQPMPLLDALQTCLPEQWHQEEAYMRIEGAGDGSGDVVTHHITLLSTETGREVVISVGPRSGLVVEARLGDSAAVAKASLTKARSEAAATVAALVSPPGDRATSIPLAAAQASVAEAKSKATAALAGSRYAALRDYAASAFTKIEGSLRASSDTSDRLPAAIGQQVLGGLLSLLDRLEDTSQKPAVVLNVTSTPQQGLFFEMWPQSYPQGSRETYTNSSVTVYIGKYYYRLLASRPPRGETRKEETGVLDLVGEPGNRIACAYSVKSAWCRLE